jgi:L-alanine-DL-glutamate epimerase-like enolase superfamily enzyme
MVQKAKSLGMTVMMGCMNESSVGSAAIAQCLPQLDYVDMDGPLLLSEDIATGIGYNNGHITVGSTPGLGITMK